MKAGHHHFPSQAFRCATLKLQGGSTLRDHADVPGCKPHPGDDDDDAFWQIQNALRSPAGILLILVLPQRRVPVSAVIQFTTTFTIKRKTVHADLKCSETGSDRRT